MTELRKQIEEHKNEISKLNKQIEEKERLDRDENLRKDLETLKITSNFEEYYNRELIDVQREFDILRVHCRKLKEIIYDRSK